MQTQGVIHPVGDLFKVTFGPHELGCFQDEETSKRVCDLLNIKECVDNQWDVAKLVLHHPITSYEVEGCTLDEVLDDVADVPMDVMLEDLQSKAAEPLPRAATAVAEAPEAVRLGAAWSRLRNDSEAAAAAAEKLPPPLEEPGVRDEQHSLKPQWRRGLAADGGRVVSLGVTLTPSDCQHRRLRPPRPWCDAFFGAAPSKFVANLDSAAAAVLGLSTAGPRCFHVKVTSYGKTKGEYYWQGGDMSKLIKELQLQPGDMLVLKKSTPGPAHEDGAAPGGAAAAAASAVASVSVVRCADNPHAAVILTAAAASLAKRLTTSATAATAPPAPHTSQSHLPAQTPATAGAGLGGSGGWGNGAAAFRARLDGKDDEYDGEDEGGAAARVGSGRAARARRNPYGDDFATEQNFLWEGDVAHGDDYDEYMGGDGSDDEAMVGGKRARGQRRSSGGSGMPRRRGSGTMPCARPLRTGQRVPDAALAALRPLTAPQLTNLLTNFYTGLRGSAAAYKVPCFARRELNLHIVFWAAMERGGYEAVTEGKQWRAVCRCLNLDLTGLTSASHCMRVNYERCLLDFENYLASGRYLADVAAGRAPTHTHLTGATTPKYVLPESEVPPPLPPPGDPAIGFATRRRPSSEEGLDPAALTALTALREREAEERRRWARAAEEREARTAALAAAQAELLDAQRALAQANEPWTLRDGAHRAVVKHKARIAALEEELRAERAREEGLLQEEREAQAAAAAAPPADPGLVERVEQLEAALRQLTQEHQAADEAARAAYFAATDEDEDDVDEPISDEEEAGPAGGAQQAQQEGQAGGGKRARSSPGADGS